MQGLEIVSAKTVNEIYGESFTAIWNAARDKKVFSGRIYARKTPPWMRKSDVFVHCTNSNYSTPFNMLKLPTKSAIREPGNRNLAMAIIATIIEREESVAPYLKYLIRQNGIVLPTRNESQGTFPRSLDTYHNLPTQEYQNRSDNALTMNSRDAMNNEEMYKDSPRGS